MDTQQKQIQIKAINAHIEVIDRQMGQIMLNKKQIGVWLLLNGKEFMLNIPEILVEDIVDKTLQWLNNERVTLMRQGEMLMKEQ